jgi:hypothetical protein
MPGTQNAPPGYTLRPYRLEIEGAGSCTFAWGATDVLGDERLNYQCDTGLWGLGGPYRSDKGIFVIDTTRRIGGELSGPEVRQVTALSVLNLDDPRCIMRSGIAQAECLRNLFEEDPTVVPMGSTPALTATPVSQAPIPTETPAPQPESDSDIYYIGTVPVFKYYKSAAPYKIIAYKPGHEKQLGIAKQAAQQWEDLSGVDLFDDNSPNVVAVMFQGDDPECGDQLYSKYMATVPGYVPAEKPYTAFVWLCIDEFLLEGCTAIQHELGHILGLDDNRTPGSTGVMSYWEGTHPGTVIPYESWCHNPPTEAEIQAVRELNSTN